MLVKLLDPVERLPVHAHPDREFARAHLGSDYGKTEAWLIVATRDERGGGLARAAGGRRAGALPRRGSRSRTPTRCSSSLHHLVVRPGDVVFVPAGVPHAIGGGALIVELQEPTDFSILCEWKGFPVDPADAHLGLGWDVALEALRLDAYEPQLGHARGGGGVLRTSTSTRSRRAGSRVLLVLEGEGSIDGRPARAGDAFAMPAAAQPFDVHGDLRILRCMGGR